jgi:hypothetical protein
MLSEGSSIQHKPENCPFQTNFNESFHCGVTLLVAQLVEALRYKPEGRGFDPRWCHWKF